MEGIIYQILEQRKEKCVKGWMIDNWNTLCEKAEENAQSHKKLITSFTKN
jgi:hypothetical protein